MPCSENCFNFVDDDLMLQASFASRDFRELSSARRAQLRDVAGTNGRCRVTPIVSNVGQDCCNLSVVEPPVESGHRRTCGPRVSRDRTRTMKNQSLECC